MFQVIFALDEMNQKAFTWVLMVAGINIIINKVNRFDVININGTQTEYDSYIWTYMGFFGIWEKSRFNYGILIKQIIYLNLFLIFRLDKLS